MLFVAERPNSVINNTVPYSLLPMTTLSDDILAVNPYEGHPSLSQLEADVLWEYAKLAHHVKTVRLLAALSPG